MKIKKLNLSKYFLIVFGIILADQILKVYIKLNYSLTFYGDPAIIDYGWFRLLFIENRGMAWGAKLNDFIPFIDDKFAKLFLTLFRIVAIGFIFYWLRKSIKEGANSILKISLALILAGAIGNVIDQCFMDIYLQKAILKLQLYHLEMDTKVYFSGMWLICSNSLFLHGLGLTGSHP